MARHELAWTIANQDRNRLGEAREIFRAVLTDRRRVLGPEHPRTLTTLHELAWIAACRGETAEAESSYSTVLNQRRRILGEDHPETLATQKALEELRCGRTVDAQHLAWPLTAPSPGAEP